MEQKRMCDKYLQKMKKNLSSNHLISIRVRRNACSDWLKKLRCFLHQPKNGIVTSYVSLRRQKFEIILRL